MPHVCCVPGCKGNYRSGPRVSVFKFPGDEQLRNKWRLAIRRKDFAVTSSSKVCSLHFKDSDFEREASAYDPKTGRTLTAPLVHVRLKKDAVPSLINVNDSNKALNKEDQEKGIIFKNGQFSPRLHQNVASTEPKSCHLKDTLRSNLQNLLHGRKRISAIWASTDKNFLAHKERELENENVQNLKKRPGRKKRKGESESVTNDSPAKSSLNSSQKTLSSNHLVGKVHILSKSSQCLPAVSVKVEKPWEEEYKYGGKSCVDKSKDCDKLQIEIRDVRTVPSNFSEKTDKNEAESSGNSAVFSRPLKILKREEIFGKLVASELSDLSKSPELYLKTKRAILEILVQAQFEQIKCSGSIL